MQLPDGLVEESGHVSSSGFIFACSKVSHFGKLVILPVWQCDLPLSLAD